jgi:formylglycine-generating enzyme required for sulfatase activity
MTADHHIKKNDNIRQYIRSTAQRPGALFAFARMAAVPPYVTCDLLYRLWQHFGETLDKQGTTYQMDYMIVSDILNTAIFKEIGWDLYEMDEDIRPFFRQELEENYADTLIPRIAQFIQEYATVSFLGQENQYMRETQLFAAKAILDPEALIEEMGKMLEKAIQSENINTVYHLFLNLERLADNSLLDKAHRQTYKDMATLAEADLPNNSGTSPRLVITDNLNEPGIEITLTPRMRANLRIQRAAAAATVSNDPFAHLMVKIKGGTFLMGGDEQERETPIHEVTLNDFYIGKYQVTVEQYLAFCEATKGNYPEWLEEGSPYNIYNGTDDHYKKKGYEDEVRRKKLPIVGVSWNDAVAYINWLSKKTGKNYRLPTEAEWEYAAKGGNQSKGYKYAGSNNLDEVGWYDKNSDSKTHPVGQKKPNELGLYDMSGNVWEWCQDVWHDNYNGAPANGEAWTSGGNSSYRVLRGGSWNDGADDCRSAYRDGNPPDDRGSHDGFRIAL